MSSRPVAPVSSEPAGAFSLLMGGASLEERRARRLVAKAARGDGEAFGRLYDAYADRVFGFVRLRVDDVRDAEDLTETVFVKAWESIASYRDRGLPFSAWLFAIARNALVDEARRRGRMPDTVPVDEAEEHASPASVAEEVLANVDGAKIREALHLLTEEQTAVIVSRFLWDLTLSETAQALGKAEGAVKSLQHRALRRLAVLLIEEVDGDVA